MPLAVSFRATGFLMPEEHIAVLPMYDFPYVSDAHAALWHAIACRLVDAGVEGVPSLLAHDMEPAETWRDARLLFGQACELPLVRSFSPFLRIVGTPCYTAPGCAGRLYRSAIVVRASEPATQLSDVRHLRCAVNEPDSNSGMNLLRAAVAPLARSGPFFASVIWSGSHNNSARLIAEGQADVAAVDCVTYAHLQRADPSLTAQLRVLDWTPAAGSLPYVTAQVTTDHTLAALRAALVAVMHDPALATARAALFLGGVDVDPDPSFTLTRAHELRAAALGYPVVR